MKVIKVHYFNATTSSNGAVTLGEDLETLRSTPLQDRIRTCGYQEIRLDHIEKKIDEGVQDTYWLLRFSRFREDNWPGVASRDEASRDLELDTDSVLAEETTMLFSETHNKALVQYNHFGVRTTKIQEYLSLTRMQQGFAYQFIPVLTAEALTKYQQKKIVTSIEACIEGVSDADIEYFEGSSLKSMAEQSSENKATAIRFNFSVDARIKTEKLDRSWIERTVDKIIGRAGERDKLQVSVKENEEDAIEVLNLLEAKKVTEYDESQIERTEGRRYRPDQLGALLEQAYKEWRSQNFQS